MSNPTDKTTSFLMTRRFMPMFSTQFFGALNDNIFKQVLLLMISYGWLQNIDNVSLMTNLASLLFILPYFIFSATAGQIADRYERSSLIRLLKFSEIIIMLIATVGLFFSNVWILLFALFLMGVQSTFFGPIKYAILPEILSEKELISGNAVFQAGTSLAILFGMLLGGVLISFAKGQVWIISAGVIIVAIAGYLSSRMILKQKIAAPDLIVNWNFFQTSWQTIAYAKSLPIIFLILLGNSWYWFFGATYMTQISEMTKVYLHGNETVVSLLLTCFSVGVGIGSFICERLGKNKSPQHLIKLVACGAIGLSLFSFYLPLNLSWISPVQGNLLTLGQVLSIPVYYHSFISISLLGIVGGFYIVPLYTMMQHFSPSSHRARIVAANNILNAIFMVSSAIIAIIILTVLKLSIATLFVIVGVINAIFTLILLIKLMKMLKQYEHSKSSTI